MLSGQSDRQREMVVNEQVSSRTIN